MLRPSVVLSGKRFGRFVVLEKSLKRNSEGAHWVCKCDCGNIRTVSGHSLRLGRSKSCGCLCREIVHNRRKSFVGKKFGRLMVISEKSERDKWGHILWICKCECGNYKTIIGDSLVQGLTKSCGCLAIEVSRKQCGLNNPNFIHGGKGTHIHNSWRGMVARCFNPKDTHYYLYGGKGITICKEWRNFIAFKKWANENNYKDGLSIDRIDPEGNYEPSNCQWLTVSENSKKAWRDRARSCRKIPGGAEHGPV